MPLRPEYLNAAERRARGRVAAARRDGRQPRDEDLALLAAAKADRPVRTAMATVLRLPRRQRMELVRRLMYPELLLDPEEEEEGAHARTA
jgi:hypothetical protein